MSVFVDFHVLQTVPPCCINRDDMGSPKTAIYGETVRARVSSQAWKHAMREEFKTLFDEDDLGSRTVKSVDMVKKEMMKIDSSIDADECHNKAVTALKTAGLTIDKDANSNALFFMSNKQAKAIAELAIKLNTKNKKVPTEMEKALKEALRTNPSVDIALFGRMVAGDPTLTFDAAAEVAHAISTYPVQIEYDFLTARDDQTSNTVHLNTTEFTSSTLYRYANINATELAKTIGKENVASVIKKFGQAFVLSMPKGKQHSFASRTLPTMIYVTLRTDRSITLCDAFEAPMPESDNGYAAASESRFLKHAQSVYRQFAAPPEKEWLSDRTSELIFPELLSQLEKAVNDIMTEV